MDESQGIRGANSASVCLEKSLGRIHDSTPRFGSAQKTFSACGFLHGLVLFVG